VSSQRRHVASSWVFPTHCFFNEFAWFFNDFTLFLHGFQTIPRWFSSRFFNDFVWFSLVFNMLFNGFAWFFNGFQEVFQ